ncbi:MAG: patatin-like phospholipase family protein [Peptostreptococcaceae bacterium]|jgi:hypothetical protein|nr:patatin-like phospholipase family protein [Peptostreptococcaceae bacterium]
MSKRVGLFLQGGGAKGAFQAGAIKALEEENIEINVISATSIGAINGYFLYTKNVNKLEKFWKLKANKLANQNLSKFDSMESLTVENEGFIDEINLLPNYSMLEEDRSLYVNYVNVKNKKLNEIWLDIKELDKKERLKAIKYTSLLPCNKKNNETSMDFLRRFDNKTFGLEFNKMLDKGVYEGFNLDGGVINNNFLNPFIFDKVDKLYMIVFRKDYIIPEYIKNTYYKDQIIIIDPIKDFSSKDTLNFGEEFLNIRFEEGYKRAKSKISKADFKPLF